MKNKVFFTIGMICFVVFIVIAAYLWYIYFGEYERRIVLETEGLEFIRGVEFINSGNIDYINAKVDDTEEIIPTYYFRIKNNAEKDFDYSILIEDNDGNDGCTSSTLFKRDELDYELKLDNQVVKTGVLSELTNNLLDTNVVKKGAINDYSLRIWLNKEVVDYENKHFHYVVTLKEKE